MPSVITPSEFQALIWDYGREHRRSFPWRETHDPYRILVSEIMLQQTQTQRVVPKYEAFLEFFPDARALAEGSTADLLRLWQGLGYNRRALNLQRAAQAVVADHNGTVPQSLAELRRLPGVGPYTAGAVAAFAFNRPVPFIETNIRRAYLHSFFPDEEGVSDKELMPLIEATVDPKDPREWYYALMDYGAQLPKVTANPNRRSKHYGVQSKFEGSNRQVRGRVLKYLVEGGRGSAAVLADALQMEFARVQWALAALKDEGFVTEDGDDYRLT